MPRLKYYNAEIAQWEPISTNGAPGKDGISHEIDNTLTQDGQAADAKATGDAISQVQTNIDNVASVVDGLDSKYYTETEIDGMISDLNVAIDAKSDSDHTHNDLYYTEAEIDSVLGSMQSDIDSKVDAVDGMGLSTNDYTDADKDKLASIEANANFYEHPVHDSRSLGLYKVTVDGEGHISTVALVEKEDIVALGIPAQDTTYDEEISDLSDRIDDVENSINTTNETLEGVAQDFENYKTTNNEAVATNASGIEDNKTAIEEIQGDYLKSTDKNQLQDEIDEVSEKATANYSAIEVLNGDGEGSVKQSINDAFNQFASDVNNDDVVNTYKELIDYAAKHGPEFTTLVGKVDSIDTHVGEIDTDITAYKTEVSDNFTEIDTTINSHIVSVDNPHGVTKEQIGLASVDNTSDLEKPISNATQAALDEKANAEHEHNDLYYTKDELLEMFELIAVEDIDEICYPSSQGLVYALNSSGDGYNITGIGSCTDTDIRIPKTYKGLPVVRIDSRAFNSCNNLTSVTIPNGIIEIQLYAFLSCYNLTSITIPSSVTTLSTGAFYGCNGLTSLFVDTHNKVYYSDSNCIIHIDRKELIQGCNTSVIPDDGSVTSIASMAFATCPGLTSITIPSSVTSIGGNAFSYCTGLTSITIPSSVTSIEGNAFAYCTGLTSIAIPSSVTSIKSGAFYDCSKLTDVYYSGSQSMWNAITIGSNNTSLTNATIHYGIIDTITFTINGTSYQAEAGMTWAQWIVSDYCSNRLYNGTTYIYSEVGAKLQDASSSIVSPSAVIIPNHAYKFVLDSGDAQ